MADKLILPPGRTVLCIVLKIEGVWCAKRAFYPCKSWVWIQERFLSLFKAINESMKWSWRQQQKNGGRHARTCMGMLFITGQQLGFSLHFSDFNTALVVVGEIFTSRVWSMTASLTPTWLQSDLSLCNGGFENRTASSQSKHGQN